MLRDSVIAAIRTGVAALVGLLLGWLVSKGISLPEGSEAQLTGAFILLVTAFYNWGVNLLERYVHPYFGILLGVPRVPNYGTDPIRTSAAAPATPAEDELADDVESDGPQAEDADGRQDD